MNIRKEIDRELSDMNFESIREHASDIQPTCIKKSSKIKKYSRKFTAAAVAAAAVLTLGISAAAVWGISGLAGRSIRDLTADDCSDLEGFVVAETVVESNEISVNSVLYDGNLIYINLQSKNLWFETLTLSEHEEQEFSDNDDFIFPGLVKMTEGNFSPISGSYGDSFSGIFRVTKPLETGETIYAHILLQDDVKSTVKITVPKISSPKYFTMKNSEGVSFELYVTPLSVVCMNTGRLYNTYGGKKYNPPLHLRDENGNTIFSQVAQGHETEENNCIIPFETIADIDRVDSVRLGYFFSE